MAVKISTDTKLQNCPCFSYGRDGRGESDSTRLEQVPRSGESIDIAKSKSYGGEITGASNSRLIRRETIFL